MSWARTLALALRTLRRNPLRSFFMLLGVAVGIASLIAMASVGEATRQETLRQFKRMVGAFDTISIQPGGARTRGMPSLTTVEPTLRFEDATAIETEIPNVRRVARAQSAFDIDVQARDRTTTTSVWGISEDWMEIRGDDVSAGRGISAEDVETLARVVVIGEDVRRALFPDEDPIGKTLRIAEVPFQVQGVLLSRGAGPGGASLDDLLLLPVSTAAKRLFSRDYLTSITVQLDDPQQHAAGRRRHRGPAAGAARHRAARGGRLHGEQSPGWVRAGGAGGLDAVQGADGYRRDRHADRRRGDHEPDADRRVGAAPGDRRAPCGGRHPRRRAPAVPRGSSADLRAGRRRRRAAGRGRAPRRPPSASSCRPPSSGAPWPGPWPWPRSWGWSLACSRPGGPPTWIRSRPCAPDGRTRRALRAGCCA